MYKHLLCNTYTFETTTSIYAHFNSTDNDSGNKGKGGGKGKKRTNIEANIDLNNPSAWGRAIKQDAQEKNIENYTIFKIYRTLSKKS